MTPEQFIKSASDAGVLTPYPARLNDAIEFASDAFVEYITAYDNLSDEEVDDAAGRITGMALEQYNLSGERYTEEILSALFSLAANLHESMKQEAIKEDATRLVSSLLDEETRQVELELNTVSVDSMPHTSWMMRAIGATPTSYIAKDIHHTHELAMKAAQHKAMMLGVQITKVIDNTQGGRQ
jgi:hypothetical protein